MFLGFAPLCLIYDVVTSVGILDIGPIKVYSDIICLIQV